MGAHWFLLEVNLAMRDVGNFKYCFSNLMKSLSPHNRTTFAMIFWAIWKRNEKWWEGVVKSYGVSTSLALDHLHEWEQARVRCNHAAATDNASLNIKMQWKKQ